MKVICITGTGHCGSTLLGLLFSKHPNIVSIAEFHSFNNAGSRTKEGVSPREDPHFKTTVSLLPTHNLNVYRPKWDFLSGKNRYFFTKPKKLINYVEYEELYRAVYGDISKVSGKSIVSISCSIEHAYLLSQSSQFDVTVIHLVRNRSAVVWSYMRNYNRPVTQIWRYLGVNLKVYLYCRQNKLKSLLVEYEDLVEETEDTLKEIFKSAVISVPENLMDLPLNQDYMVGGNGMRHTEELVIKLDQRYKTEMPKVWLHISNTLLYPLIWLLRG